MSTTPSSPRSSRRNFLTTTAAGTAAALLWIPGNWYILIGGLCAGLAGLVSSKVGSSRHD